MPDDPATKRTPLEVLHLRTSDRLGGPERLLLDQAALAAPDVSVTLASFGRPRRPHPFLDAAREAGIETVLVEQRSSYDPRATIRVRGLLNERSPHVVVGHDYRANGVLALTAGSLPRVAVVHGYTAEDIKIRAFEALDRRFLLGGALAVVVVSEALRETVVSAGVVEDRVHVVPNGIRSDLVIAQATEARASVRREWSVGDDEVVVLALGRLSPEKGQDVLLEAFARVGSTAASARLVLVGDGALRGILETRAAAADLAGRVVLAGWRSDPWACLGAADVFALPSRREGLPLAMLEAMAVGLPIVATRVGAVAAAVEEERAAHLIAPEDADGLADALRGLIEDAGERSSLGHRARSRVESAFSAERQTRRLEQIYQSVSEA